MGAHQADITPEQRKIIFQARKSFLYIDGKPWVKRGDQNFDVGMGSHDGAQVCELVGLFILSQMTHLTSFGAFSNSTLILEQEEDNYMDLTLSQHPKG